MAERDLALCTSYCGCGEGKATVQGCRGGLGEVVGFDRLRGKYRVRKMEVWPLVEGY